MCVLELSHILTKMEQLTIISCSALRIMAGLFMRDSKNGDYTWKNAINYCADAVAKEAKTGINFSKHISDCFEADNFDMIKKYVNNIGLFKIERRNRETTDSLGSICDGLGNLFKEI